MTRRLFLSFPMSAADKPVLSTLTSRFGLVFNIFGATVSETERFVAIELEGDGGTIDAAIAFLRAAGVSVEMREPPQSH